MLPSVTKAKYVRDYLIEVKFNDGTKVIDFEPWLTGPIFKPLKSKAYFKRWIPDDKDTTSFVENYQLTETFFETAFDAQRRGWSEFSAEVRKLQLEWAFKAGKYENGWHVLERSVYGMATLALLAEDPHLCDALKTKIKQQLVKPDAPQKEIRDRAARNIRGRAATLPRDTHSYSRIDGEMNRINYQKSRPFLEDLADIISPDTAGEPVRPDFPL